MRAAFHVVLRTSNPDAREKYKHICWFIAEENEYEVAQIQLLQHMADTCSTDGERADAKATIGLPFEAKPYR